MHGRDIPRLHQAIAKAVDQFNQALVVDETTGALGLIYYDTVADATRRKSDIWYQSTFDDGVSSTTAPPVPQIG